MDDEDRELVERLRRIARHAPALETPTFTFGQWEPSRQRDDGVTVLGWFEPSVEASAFLDEFRGWITPFDWPAWASSAEGQALLGHPEAVGSATADDLRRLMTVYIRSERFGEGTLEAAFGAGMFAAVARRAGVLADELEGR